MTDLHVASSGALTRALADDVIAAIKTAKSFAVSQAIGIVPNDIAGAAAYAIYEVSTELQDHLEIQLATTLATFGITAEGDTR